MFTAKHLDTANQTALFCWYAGQTSPQDVMIAVDIRNGEVTARYNPEIGNAVSEAEYDGEWRMTAIGACPTVDYANELIDACVAELNVVMRVNGWEIGNFAVRGDCVAVLDEVVEEVVRLHNGNTLHHLECDRDQELAVWDECGNYVCPAEEI
jgi:hypothetical protein